MSKTPNPTDVYVGRRIRARRMMLRMSQETLGDGLCLTFQQVQKYEKGANRISASRLQTIATILQVPVSFFFEDGPHPPPAAGDERMEALSTDSLTEFIESSDGLALIKAFAQIKSPVVRRSIIQMVEAIANSRT